MKPGWRIRRLTDGSAIAARRLGRVIVPTDEQGEVRLIASAVRCSAGLWAVSGLLTLAHQSPTWILGGTSLWCAAAWRATKPSTPATAASEPDDEAATEPEEPDESAEFLALLHELMPGTQPGRDDRIHLAQIATAWTGEEGADTAPIRALLAQAGIPTTACRVPGRGSSTGIYLRDVPPLPEPSREPPPAVVGGPDQQQQHQQRSEAAAREGFWTKDDPDNPHRSVIEWENAS